MALQINTSLIAGTTVVYDDTLGGVAIDYTSQLESIANSLVTLTGNSTPADPVDLTALTTTLQGIAESLSSIVSSSNLEPLVGHIATIATETTTIAEKQTAIETYQKKVKELAEGAGIHILSPYEMFQMVTIYRLLVEQGKILDTSGDVSDAEKTAAIAKVAEYLTRVDTNIPKAF